MKLVFVYKYLSTVVFLIFKKILQLYVAEYVTFENFREVSYIKPLHVL